MHENPRRPAPGAGPYNAGMQAPILRVAVPSPLPAALDYLAPPGPLPPLVPGLRVRVPLKNGERIGVLLDTAGASELASTKLKPALAILDDTPLLPAELLALGHWAAGYYHHPPGEVFATLLPAALRDGQPPLRRCEPGFRITEAGRLALQEQATGRSARRRAVLATLSVADGALALSVLRERHALDGALLRTLCERGWVERLDDPQSDAPRPAVAAVTAPALHDGQAAAVAAIDAAAGKYRCLLLDGVTGSGKTEVYLGAIAAVLARGRQALVLVPEIALTPQLVERFRARLSGRIAVLHSGLAGAERLNAWLDARDGRADVVIGTRSAVFAPLARPGLIVVDEEHDASYKQHEGFRYSARDLAVVRAHAAGVPLVLGSATPSLESLANVAAGRYTRLALTHRAAAGAAAPRMELIDVRRAPLDEGLSAPLLARMRAQLDAGAQVLLFLNRRGWAPVLYCCDCGWLAECSRCDARYTVHRATRRLICHHCGTEHRLPARCPKCGGTTLTGLGLGTERIEQALERHFPGIGIARIDRDTTRRKGSLEAQLDAVRSGAARLLIGTQMLAKGHDFPDVGLVGIVDADQGLFGADFRSAERLAQLVVQVAGRAGRAGRPGTVAIQTHHPEHPLFMRLLRGDYAAIAAELLAERRAARLPPFGHQALLRAEATDAEAPAAFLTAVATLAEPLLGDGHVQVHGPVPAPMERRAGRYRAQLLFEAGARAPLHALLDALAPMLGRLPQARLVRWSLDVDPQDLY